MNLDELRQFVKDVLQEFDRNKDEDEMFDTDEVGYAFEIAIDKLERKEDLMKLVQEVGASNVRKWLEEYDSERRY